MDSLCDFNHQYSAVFYVLAGADESSDQATVDAVVATLKEIEAVSPTKEAYSNLCLLLTVNKLSDHPEYRAWNPSKGRVACFRSILPLVSDLLGGSAGPKTSPTSDDPPEDQVAVKDRCVDDDGIRRQGKTKQSFFNKPSFSYCQVAAAYH